MSGFILADAMYYVNMASEFSLEEILFFGYFNILGPVLFIKLMGLNIDLVILVYLSGFALALRELGRHTSVQLAKFAFLLLANPLVFINLVSPNKEIAMVLAILFIIVHIHSGRFSHVLMAIGFAAISKIEFLILILFFLGVRKILPKRRSILLGLLLVLISLFYGTVAALGGRDQILIEGQAEGSAGIVMALHNLAAQHFLFVIVAIPRLVVVAFEGVIVFLMGGQGDRITVVSNAWSGIMFATIGLSVIRKIKLRLEDDAVLLLFLLMLMVAIIPFPHHRYLLPTYPLLLYFMLRPQSSQRPVASAKVSCVFTRT